MKIIVFLLFLPLNPPYAAITLISSPWTTCKSMPCGGPISIGKMKQGNNEVPDKIETLMTAQTQEALKFQRPLEDGELKIVARGEKKDGA